MYCAKSLAIISLKQVSWIRKISP